MTTENDTPLEPFRFGEYLCEQGLINDEQLLEALALHWSERSGRIGSVVAAKGFLTVQAIEDHAFAYHGLYRIELVSVQGSLSRNDGSRKSTSVSN